MKSLFPHDYKATTIRSGPAAARIESGERAVLAGGPPPEFAGDSTSWSPEHLLAASLGLCLFTTFEAFAMREKLQVVDWRDTVTARLDRTSQGLAFKSFVIDVEITVDESDLDRAKEVLDRAKKNCIISKALSTEPEVVSHIRSQAPSE